MYTRHEKIMRLSELWVECKRSAVRTSLELLHDIGVKTLERI